MITGKDGARLEHIVDSANLIAEYLNSVQEKEFLSLTQLQDSVIRRLEIIGEACSHISEELKEKHPEIAWRKATGLRNILAHEYFDVDMLSVWVTATEYIPLLSKQLNKVLEK